MSASDHITDRLEITDLFTRLARLLDEERHELARTVYADDVVVHSPRGGELRGIDEVLAFLRRSQVEGERTQHVHGDVQVSVDGERAEASANQLVYFYRDGEPPHRSGGVRLDYTATRTPEGWRVREARITPAWIRDH
ncbi:SnoaL-like domain-containing protein [Amycolatopsis arida]|uniref:SnoaL-like domain-containing protein n=1 Tax=Amycolatopsis arida TaxID=587909 RepID=A0A1I6AKS3_9PSEU|nr:nuclear transport factor 2 family protein [Amycolatopsis arida]TDX87357.1 SnoaL-like protein [Amycolatopsis arida]SFQ69279.1 SnoaL-like domain-containing protein [Amycolatopsis arida]